MAELEPTTGRRSAGGSASSWFRLQNVSIIGGHVGALRGRTQDEGQVHIHSRRVHTDSMTVHTPSMTVHTDSTHSQYDGTHTGSRS